MKDGKVELLARKDGELIQLLSPLTGLFTCAISRGTPVGPGQEVGTVLVLGRAQTLTVPPGVQGLVTSPRPERVHAPVGYGQVLYELSALGSLGGEEASTNAASPADDEGALILRSPQSGRFYHRSAPDAPVLAKPGSELAEGTPVGLVEVMKTFTHVPYRAEGGLPSKAKVVRLIAGDGQDVSVGDPLVEVAAL